MAQPKFYGAEAPTGGTEYSMDSIAPATLTDRDACFVIDRATRTCCIYSLSEFSGAAATSELICPHVVKPLTEVGDKRWILVDVMDNTNQLPTTALADGGYAGLVVTDRLYGEVVVKYDLLYMNGTTGRWCKAGAASAGKFPALGMAMTAGGDGDAAIVLRQGTVRNDGWAWSAPGVPLFLSTVEGAITETAPVVSGQCVQHVGRVLVVTNDVVLFDPGTLWIELA